MKITENQLLKENEEINYVMNEMMIIYQNELNKINKNNEMMWLKQEIKNKEKEIEEIKTIIQKLQKQKSDLIQ
jgi:hypothetical protein